MNNDTIESDYHRKYIILSAVMLNLYTEFYVAYVRSKSEQTSSLRSE